MIKLLTVTHAADIFLENVTLQHPKCTFEGCSNFGELNKRLGAKKLYRKYCSTHKRIFYGMSRSKRTYFYKKSKRNKTNICSKCSKFSDQIHLHRIKAGKDGGVYEADNVIKICADCHYEIHRNLLN